MRVLTQPWYVSVFFCFPISTTSNVELGTIYRIRIAEPSSTQPAGWYLNAHRSLSLDRDSTIETRVSAHKESNAYWAGEWMFEQGSSMDSYKIKLMSAHQGQRPGWYLHSVAGEARVLVKATSQASEWSVQLVTTITLNGMPTLTIRVLPTWAWAGLWVLTARRDLAHSRSATSTFAIVQEVDQIQGNATWLLEPICIRNDGDEETIPTTPIIPTIPQCSYDEDEGGCHISRTYTAEVVRSLQGGSWQSIIEHLALCEEKGKTGVNACLQTPGCEIDSLGRCAAATSWSMEALIAMPSNEGLGIGEHHKCGLFGQLLNLSKYCAFNTTQDCHLNSGGSRQCAWNEGRGECEVSPAATQSFLFESFREELAYVSLRRLKCVAKTSASTCDGDCEWSEGRCSLHPMRSLLAVLGPSCPLSHYFKRQTECKRAIDQFTCTRILGVDGLTQCRWTGTSCDYHAISMELDILMSLGLGPLVHKKLSEGSRQCREKLDELACLAFCAYLPAAPQESAANRHTLPFYEMLVLLLPMVILFQ